jgi:hypothetical protein
MKVGALFWAGIVLLAAGELIPKTLEPLGTLSQLSAVAILGYIAIYIVTRLLPKQHEEYVHAMERLQDQQVAEMREFRTLLAKLLMEKIASEQARTEP